MINKLYNPALRIVRGTMLVLFVSTLTDCSNGGKGISGSGDYSIADHSSPPDKSDSTKQDYQPRFWIEGFSQKKFSKGEDNDLKEVMDKVASSGWNGVMCWGADRDGSRMNYYFKSGFLEKQDWAIFKQDNLSPIVRAAHNKGLKVIINIEGVNPYHWKLNHWNPDNIREVANDLSSDSIDALFEECFEVKPEVFLSLAGSLRSKGIYYISGTDPMILREANFTSLWPETGVINIYNYYLKRDKIFNIATLTQNGSLGYGWAKYWGRPTSLISPLTRDWGIQTDYSPAIVTYLCMIRALQFRLDNFIIFGGMEKFDPVATRAWIREYTAKQEKKRPLMNIVVLLKKQTEYSGSDNGDQGWNRLFNSGDAITSGAMNAGYDIIVSDKVIAADAYYIYTRGGYNEVLPGDVVDLFSSDKPVFIQCAGDIPSGKKINSGWRTVLEQAGIDGTMSFRPGLSADEQSEVSESDAGELEIPYTGYYKNVYLRFTGADIQRGIDLCTGTVIPKEAISGTIYCSPNKTYGRGPFITGKNKKYLITSSSLSWQAAFPISDLLSGSGIAPSSNVWGIAGKNVTALLAIETTELEIVIPGLLDGENIHVVVWDKNKNKKSDETAIYKSPFRKVLSEYDFILINRVPH